MGPISTILTLIAGGTAILAAEAARRRVVGIRLEAHLRQVRAPATGTWT